LAAASLSACASLLKKLNKFKEVVVVTPSRNAILVGLVLKHMGDVVNA